MTSYSKTQVATSTSTFKLRLRGTVGGRNIDVLEDLDHLQVEDPEGGQPHGERVDGGRAVSEGHHLDVPEL